MDLSLNLTHGVANVVRVYGVDNVVSMHCDVDDVVAGGTVDAVLGLYDMWHALDLRKLAALHGVDTAVRDNVDALRVKLLAHDCGIGCGRGVCVLFRTLSRRRSEEDVARAIGRRRDGDAVEDGDFMEIASDELKLAIMSEWQEVVHTDRLKMLVCAVCGRRMKVLCIKLVNVNTIDLTLLRNDELPRCVWPTTYAFELYERALLHPKGMRNLVAKDDINVCASCEADLCGKARMPKYSLANYLYYAHEELQPVVKSGFDGSTVMERMLIARGRTSRVSFRFGEVGGSGGRDACDESTAAQSYTKGNVLVMPQDSTHLNDLLPPSPEVIRDMICAVFVGQTAPTKETISRLGPILVRKPVVQTLITFLVGNNAHYMASSDFHGFSRSNLDQLFSDGDSWGGRGVPCSMEIGFLPDSDAVRGATSDYSTRNDSGRGPEVGDDMLVENVGYTDSDETPRTSRQLKMCALKYCLAGGQYMLSRAGNQFIPDFQNPSLLTWLFPHLDPWGIGGFFEPARKVPLSLDDQLTYLLQVDGAPFARDPEFAFVYYNIRQKKAVCESINFRVKVSQQREIIRDLTRLDKDVLARLIERFGRNPFYSPMGDDEKGVMRVLDRVRMVGRDLPGTAAYKVMLRNEIRALINFKGTPALFVTLNPSDVNHPLVRLYSGEDIRLEDMIAGEELTTWQRKVLAAQNPVACALFFNTMIESFINVVLRYGRSERGLFGRCSAYFGTVEAQGKGTLHCHMLIWLEGHPSPQKMRDYMSASRTYQERLIAWLESLVRCELLGTDSIVREEDGVALPRPRYEEEGRRHPATVPLPIVTPAQPDEFWTEFEYTVNELVKAFNWHEHTDTCWKYLRATDPRDDAHCRMRINGRTRATTGIDDDTGSILLRRLHPRIACYNEVVTFLMQCNMDIKHVGSGEAANALVQYITGYVTKASVPTHVGLAALLYAIRKLSGDGSSAPQAGADNPKSALMMTVNRMLSRQEISHQQVMSYLVGGGDHYKSHRFRVLFLGAFERFFDNVWDNVDASSQRASDGMTEAEPGTHAVDRGDNGDNDALQEESSVRVRLTSHVEDAYDEDVMLHIGAGTISAVNQQQDYMFRSEESEFEMMCLYEFVGMTEKMTKRSEDVRVQRREHGDAGRGRRLEARGDFKREHPQYNTHMIRRRTLWVIPVVLGDRIPRNDRSDEERDRWARTMLILFIPWRHPKDVKASGESWFDAFERQRHLLRERHWEIVRNMNVLSECRDAADSLRQGRRGAATDRGNGAPDVDHVGFAGLDGRLGREIYGELFYDELDGFGDSDGSWSEQTWSTLQGRMDHLIGARVRVALDACFRGPAAVYNVGSAPVSRVDIAGDVSLREEASVMKELKRKRVVEVSDDGAGARRR